MQSVSTSTRRKRVSSVIATSCALALAGGALSAAPASAQYPAAGQEQARKTALTKIGMPYRCKATNAVVNDAIGGPQLFRVNTRVPLRGKFKGGTKVRVGKIRLTLVMPKRLVRKVRRDLKVKRVRGSANVRYLINSNPGKVRVRKVRGVRSGWKKLPRNHRLRIPTTGRAKNFRLSKRAKRVQLWAPKRFTIHAKLRPPAVGIVPKTNMKCKSIGKRKNRFIGRIKVR